MTKQGTKYQLHGTYVEHKGRFAQAVSYHPLDRSLHHVFEFEADYAIKTELTAEARIMLGTKVIDTKGGSNDWYGIGTCVREVAREIKRIQADYQGAIIQIVVKVEKTACILAPVTNPEYRREYTNMPNDWYLAEDKAKLEAAWASTSSTYPADDYPRRMNEVETEEITVWDSAKPTDFAALTAFASRYNLSAEKLEIIMKYLA